MRPAAALLVLFLSSPAAAQTLPAAYRFESLPKTPAELAKRFTPAQIDILEMLNRRDRGHLLRVDPPSPGLLVPLAWADDLLTYSPFPRMWTAAEPYPKAIIVHQAMQAFGAYENGR